MALALAWEAVAGAVTGAVVNALGIEGAMPKGTATGKVESAGEMYFEASPKKVVDLPKTFAMSQDALLVTMLVEQSRRFREAAGARKALLTAVERYYLDVVSCHWHLDAIQTMLSAVESVVGTSGVSDQDAVQHCLKQIDVQKLDATEALEERFQNYGVGVLTPGGQIERIGSSGGDRQQGLRRLRHFVADSFAEIGLESRELAQVAASGAGLRSLLPTIQRRQKFWQDQFEEVWAAWIGATARMHSAGEDAVRAWIWLTASAKWTERVPTPASARGLADVASQLLEVELLDSLGLVGLDSAIHAARRSHAGYPMQASRDDAKSQEELAEGWQMQRFALLRSVLHRLAEAGVPEDAEFCLPSKVSELGRLSGEKLN